MRPELRTGKVEGFWLPGNPWGVPAEWEARQGALLVEWCAREVLSPGLEKPFLLHPAVRLGEASTLQSGKLNCTF